MVTDKVLQGSEEMFFLNIIIKQLRKRCPITLNEDHKSLPEFKKIEKKIHYVSGGQQDIETVLVETIILQTCNYDIKGMHNVVASGNLVT